MQETIGKRIARLRQGSGWTQQALAARLAISRVAVSHLEMDLTIPGERTITLLAGLFKLTPHELVDGTSYPHAKAERLPQVTCTYTPLELDLALLENDLAWLARLKCPEAERLAHESHQHWAARLDKWAAQTIDDHEKDLLAAARQRLQLAG
jgi:transcriptional regulator with XRE-family HTH domain